MSQRWPLNTVLTLQFILHVYYVIAVERLNSDMIVHVYMLMISSTFCTTTHTVLTRCFCWKSLTGDFSVFFHWECSGIPANYFLYIIPPLIERGLYCNHLVRLSVCSHFRNRYLSFYWKKWFYIWYMTLAWWKLLFHCAVHGIACVFQTRHLQCTFTTLLLIVYILYFYYNKMLQATSC
jgi:hypothetical protein